MYCYSLILFSDSEFFMKSTFKEWQTAKRIIITSCLLNGLCPLDHHKIRATRPEANPNSFSYPWSLFLFRLRGYLFFWWDFRVSAMIYIAKITEKNLRIGGGRTNFKLNSALHIKYVIWPPERKCSIAYPTRYSKIFLQLKSLK